MEALAEDVNQTEDGNRRVRPPKVPSAELSARLAAQRDGSDAVASEQVEEWPEFRYQAEEFDDLPEEEWDVYGERAGQQTLDAAVALPEGTDAPSDSYEFLDVCKLNYKECEEEYNKVVAFYRVRALEQAKSLEARGFSPLKAHEDHEFLVKNRRLLTYQRDLEFRMAEFSLPTAKQVAEWELPNEQNATVMDDEADWADGEEEYDPENDVLALEERAEEDDVAVEKIPAASDLYPLHAATTPVLTLVSGYFERFRPDQSSYDVLSKEFSLPSLRQLKEYDSVPRPEPPSQTAGLAKRDETGAHAGFEDRLPEEDTEFGRYIGGFMSSLDVLKSVRDPWVNLVPIDDVIHYDEVAFRLMEGRLLADLSRRGVPARELRAVYCARERFVARPDVKAYKNDGRYYFTFLIMVLNKMEKQYRYVMSLLRASPSAEIVADLAAMNKLLETLLTQEQTDAMKALGGESRMCWIGRAKEDATYITDDVDLAIMDPGSSRKRKRIRGVAVQFDGVSGHLLEMELKPLTEFTTRQIADLESGQAPGGPTAGGPSALENSVKPSEGKEEKGTIPPLSAPEVRALVERLISIPQVRQGIVDCSALKLSEDGRSAKFRIEFGKSKDAHHVLLHLFSHDLLASDGSRYILLGKRTHGRSETSINEIPDLDEAGEERDEFEPETDEKYLGKAKPPPRGRGTSRWNKLCTPDPKATDDVDSSSDTEDEDEMLVCMQCYMATDAKFPHEVKDHWHANENGTFGVRSSTGELYCSHRCLEDHENNVAPKVPSIMVQYHGPEVPGG